ncbi:MAG: VIT family protein [Burkholderiaceae bacterium]|uniref:VIT family protein n=1 Tax=Herminiimonas contaminans TaxID=1111140 RepID=A0ABS0EUY0_9BURK|nr:MULTISPECIES: VIT family protein [Oxalobacteraceae]MBF8178656.1 VIT family protein [Herminiimonas contaminans]MBX9800134.1 VIT family protein [Burkholderiaceae bacterium]
MPDHRSEKHFNGRIGWLRAAVLGANDGIISTSCLLLGVASANLARNEMLLTGIAALVAGAMSMAAGEYVSVSSQADTEQAELDREQQELLDKPDAEHRELASIYVARGLTPDLAKQVAQQLMAHDALSAHARDELGIHEASAARPVQAAITSALTFSLGSALPLLTALLVPGTILIPALGLTSLLFLVGLGTLAAKVGGAPLLPAALRVGFWGALAMIVTSVIGDFFGTIV